MTAYAIILNNSDPVIAQRITEKWPRHYPLSDSVFFVTQEDPSTTVEVAEALGMNEERKVLGIVVEVGENNFGYNYQRLCRWRPHP